MRRTSLKAALAWVFVSAALSAPAGAVENFLIDQTPVQGPEASASNIRIEEPATHESPACDQFFTFALGAFSPESVAVSNGTYTFDYGSHPATYQAQASWALKLLPAAGGFYFEGTVAFSSFSGSAVQNPSSGLATSSYAMGLLGLDARMMYSLDALPVRWLSPFADAGYRYSIFYQPGASGLESVEGGVGNPVASAGLRFWVNRRSSMAGGTPWFLTAKVERVFPQTDSLNLASTSLYGGITLGL